MLTYDESVELMENLFQTTKDVAVFVDRGWGDDLTRDTEYTIITNGNGSEPHAQISREVYQQLLNDKVIAPNNLNTYKARKNHQYRWDDYIKWCENGYK